MAKGQHPLEWEVNEFTESDFPNGQKETKSTDPNGLTITTIGYGN
jgi:hypothetical protein